MEKLNIYDVLLSLFYSGLITTALTTLLVAVVGWGVLAVGWESFKYYFGGAQNEQ